MTPLIVLFVMGCASMTLALAARVLMRGEHEAQSVPEAISDETPVFIPPRSRVMAVPRKAPSLKTRSARSL